MKKLKLNTENVYLSNNVINDEKVRKLERIFNKNCLVFTVECILTSAR